MPHEAMKTIAQIAHSAPGGASDLCATLAIAARAEGVGQAIAFWGNEPAWPDRVARCRAHGIETEAFEKKRGLDPRAHGPIYEWVRCHSDASAFIVHYPAALFAVRAALRGRRRPRIVLVEHHSNALKNARKWLMSALALWLADGVVYLTDAYRDQVADRLGPWFRPRRTAVIANGIDLARYRPPAALAGSPRDRILVGMAARMLPPKDHATLLAAFAEVVKTDPQLGLVLELAGDGPKLPEVEAQIDGLGIRDRVRLLGMIPQEELIRRMWAWDVGVLSTFGETQSLAIMEGLACGLPLLATRVPGVVDAMEHGVNGLLVPAGDAAAMAEGLRMLARSDLLRARLRQSARDWAEKNFSSKRMWGGYRRFIELLGAGRSRAACGGTVTGMDAADAVACPRIQP